MRRTVLDMTQNILSALTSDEVNSISDTTEAMQVAEILKTTYFNIISRTKLPVHKQLVQLVAPIDIDTPTLMTVPDNIGRIEWIKYFNNKLNGTVPFGYAYVTVLPIQQFIDMTNGFNPGESNVQAFDFTISGGENYTFYYKDDTQPTYCTVLSDHYVIFDSFNSVLESTLQSSNTMVFGQMVPSWTMSDDFIPNLADEQFALLFNEAKSLAFFELKQMVHTKAEQENKRQWSAIQKSKSLIERPSSFDALPNFGRK